jgi:hypothetical protein
MKQMMGWCRESKWINGRNKTVAQMRDDLADSVTAFVEEADKTENPRGCENWYQNRYDEGGNDVSYRRLYVTSTNKMLCPQETHNHFGYTILHTQNAVQSIELDRRILRINIPKDSHRKYESTEGLDDLPLLSISNEVDWQAEIPQGASNSAWDVWLPFMRVAIHLGDEKFLEYAREQIELKTEEDDLTKVFEPRGIILSEIAEAYKSALNVQQRRICIGDIRIAVNGRGYLFDERQIVKEARSLGFEVYYPGNKAHVKVLSREQLDAIMGQYCIAQNVEDEEVAVAGSALVASH